MTWKNLTNITANKTWSYSPPFVSTLIRVRHSLNVYPDKIPYRFYGLIGQAYGYPNLIELFKVRRLYPTKQHSTFLIPNPFSNRERRIAIKGQLYYYKTPVIWHAFIDIWTGEEVSETINIEQQLDAIENKVDRQLVVAKEQANYTDIEYFEDDLHPGYF